MSSAYLKNSLAGAVWGLLLLGIAGVSCTRKAYVYHPITPVPIIGKAHQEGLASWYGRKFHGRRTASGVRYNMKKMTAAHRHLPFGTRVRVTNLANDRSVEVVITDRGPFLRRRVIDLSRGAARKIGMLGTGVAWVHLEVLQPEGEGNDGNAFSQ